MAKTVNDSLCCNPFPFTGAVQETRASGLKQISNYSGLVALKVLADGFDGVKAGDTIYVSAKDFTQPYGKNRFKLDTGIECIFVPRSAILLVGLIQPDAPEAF